MAKLTKQDALNYPANFLYVWAADSFLAQLDAKSASIIGSKRDNQKKLLFVLSNDSGDFTKYNALVNEVRNSFITKYGKTPAEALVILASGGSIAGKNWKEGVYGIGAAGRNNFSQNPDITVDPETGEIYYKGVKQDCTPVYKKDQITNQNAVIDGATYSSIYDKSTKRFYAYQYAPEDGEAKYNASGEKVLFGNMTNDMWQDILGITSQWGDWLLGFLRAFQDIFGWPPKGQTTETTATPPPLTTKNTAPNQKKDGFLFDQGTDWGILAIVGVAAAALLFRRKKG